MKYYYIYHIKMKINLEFIKKIFNRKIKLTKNEDKKKLSKYD